MTDEKFYSLSSSSNIKRLRKAHALLQDVSTELLKKRAELFLFKAMQEEVVIKRDKLTQFAYQIIGELQRRQEDIAELEIKFNAVYRSYNP
jgi:hypothetical protein